MANEWAPAPPPKAPRKWPKRLGWSVLGLLFFLVIVYWVVTSSFFFETFVLPRVSTALNAQVTVSSATIRPFSRVILRDLKVKTDTLSDPLFQAPEIMVHYSLWDILGGEYHVKELRLIRPVVSIVEYEDGTRNVDVLTRASTIEEEPAEESGQPSAEPIQVNLGGMLLTNATLRMVKNHPSGGVDTMEISRFSLSLTNVSNGERLGLQLEASLLLQKEPDLASTNRQIQRLQAELEGEIRCLLSPKLMPDGFQGSTKLTVREAPPEFADLAGLTGGLEFEVYADEITQILLRFQNRESKLGQVRLSGPLNIMQQEGQARLEVSGIDRNVLNLVGAGLGVDFNETSLNVTNDLSLSGGGKVVSVKGGIKVDKLGVTQEGFTSKPLNLNLNYDARLDQNARTLQVQRFTVTAIQDQAPILGGVLAQPMSLSLGGGSNLFENSTFALSYTNIHLQDWKPILGDYDGRIHGSVYLAAQEGGRDLTVSVDTFLMGLAMPLAGNRLDQVDLQMRIRTKMREFKSLALEECVIRLDHQKRTLVTMSAGGVYDLEAQHADVKSQTDLALGAMGPLFVLTSQPDLQLNEGMLSLQMDFRQTNYTRILTNRPNLHQMVQGRILMTNVTGQLMGWPLDRFELRTDWDVTMADQVATMRQCNGQLRQAEREGGAFGITGSYQMSNQVGEVALHLTNLNEVILAGFIPVSTNGAALTTISVGMETSARYDARGASAVTSQLDIGNLRLGSSDSKPGVPLGMKFELAGKVEKGMAELQRFSGTFSGGDQAGGNFDMTGQYHVNRRIGKLSFKLRDFNQHFAAPLLASAMGEIQVAALSVNMGLEASYDAQAVSSLKGDFSLGNFSLNDPRGALPKEALDFSFDLDGVLDAREARIRLKEGSLRLGNQPGGRLTLDAAYQLETGAGKATFGLQDVNQNLLAPFLVSSLPGKTIESISLGGLMSCAYQPKGESRLDGEFRLSNIRVNDPAHPAPMMPLSMGVALNAGMMEQVLKLDQFKATLARTDRAQNELVLAGVVDMTESNAITGNLKLTSSGLDLTPYYDLLSAPVATNQPGPAKPAEPVVVQPDAPGGEPAPVRLPFKNFLIETALEHVYLREIDVARLQSRMVLDPTHVQVEPFQTVVNSGSVDMAIGLELGVPGYEYDMKLSVQGVPLEPMANSFAPEFRGQYKGDIMVDGAIKGAGITGVNLRKHLAGHLDFNLTNATIHLAQPKLKAFFLPIAVMLASPGMMDSPITWAGLQTKMGQGQINLTRAGAVSRMFVVETMGVIAIADDLMQSTLNRLPVVFYVEQELAKRLRMVPRGTPKDALYVRLPEFVKVQGTLGSPAPELDKKVLAGSVIKSVINDAAGQAAPASGTNPFDLFKK